MPFSRYVLVCFLRCLARVPSQNALPDMLFTDEHLMSRIGFNAHQMEEGLTQRGADRREGPRRNVPVDPEAVTKNILKIPITAMRHLFQTALRLIWQALPDVPDEIGVLIDGTLIGCGESAKGAGRRGRKKKVRLKEGLSTITEYFTGFQLVWAYVPQLGLPIALGFSKAGLDERKVVLPLLSRAERVIKGISRIRWIAIDRGFMSGPLLHEIAERGYEFVIPARHDMDVYKEARKEAADPKSALQRFHKMRKTRSMRRSADGGPLRSVSHTLEVVGIEGIAFETFAPESKVGPRGHADAYKKQFVAPTINAVVVLTENGKDADMVILTNAPVSDPIASFDRYDMRSLIENEGNRTLKQSWHMEKAPQRSAKGVQIHAIFVVLCFALAQAHRIQLEHDQREEYSGPQIPDSSLSCA